jgi:hypothetical protein
MREDVLITINNAANLRQHPRGGEGSCFIAKNEKSDEDAIRQDCRIVLTKINV